MKLALDRQSFLLSLAVVATLAACTDKPPVQPGTGDTDESSDTDSTTTAQPSCADGVQNQDESDIDCGGTCSPCAEGDACAVPDDCDLGSCLANVCDAPPALVSVTPANGDAFVDPSTVVTLEFSEPVDLGSVNRRSFSVNRQGTTDVVEPGLPSLAGTWSTSGNTATFTPSVRFSAESTTYSIQIGGCAVCGSHAITDLTGNAVQGMWLASFTTLPVAPGQYKIANTIESDASHRVTQGSGASLSVSKGQAGIVFTVAHIGGGEYTFLNSATNTSLAMRSSAGGTYDVGSGSAWRDAELNSTATALTVSTQVFGGTVYYGFHNGDFTLQRMCSNGGYCEGANLQFVQGSLSDDSWYLIP